MKVLVTGGAGFIGSHIVDKLVKQDWQVVVLDNLSSGRREHVPQAAKLIVMDVASDDLTEVFKTEQFDYVIHLAAQTSVPASLTDPENDGRINIIGTIKVLEAARVSGVKRIIFASTAAVYGSEAKVPIIETDVVRPASFYGLSKLTVEQYLRVYKDLFGLEYVVLRFANVYGERQGDTGEGGVISIFARRILAGQSVNIFGDGNQTRDFIYVGDVANANIRALTAPCSGVTANISTNTEISVNKLTEVMGKIAKCQVEKTYLAARNGDIYRSSLDNSTAIKALGWQPETDLDAGLVKTLAALKM
ncbi:MAG: UDP-glucose 4-epimerase [Firmicutes bacterium]|nr:UDP-glucose 4-epimerase [Bacillota bacterium]